VSYLRHPEVRRMLTQDHVFEEPRVPPEEYVRYRDWLVLNGGRPMERALIRAEQRYDRLKPARHRISALHSLYRQKRRGWT